MFKTNSLCNATNIAGGIREESHENKCLVQELNLNIHHDNEIKEASVKKWKASGIPRRILRSFSLTCLKRKVYNQYVLTATNYGFETWKQCK